jgi:hypothetical protein
LGFNAFDRNQANFDEVGLKMGRLLISRENDIIPILNFGIEAKYRPYFADRYIMIPERREDRELCADLVKVQWEIEPEKSQSEWAILEDISPSGVCLEIENPIPPGTVVSLEFPKDRCQARVVYCRFDEVKYLIGLEFEQGYRWSRRRFKPQHLIQFRLRKVSKSQ